MPEVAHLVSVKPQSPVVTEPNFSSTRTTFMTTTTTPVPWEELHMQVHTILIVVIFCVVCFLLLLAFFYAFCFHCSISSSPRDTSTGCSLDREDATYKCSSSDSQSAGNIVWLRHWYKLTNVWLSISVLMLASLLWWNTWLCVAVLDRRQFSLFTYSKFPNFAGV